MKPFKPFNRAILLLISTLGLGPGQVLAGEVSYFLVAEGPGIPETDRKNDSYVLPLSKQEEIDHARYLISRWQSGYFEADRPLVVANIVAATKEINRNFLDPKFPKWSWQVSQFLEFGDYTAEVLDGCPTCLENQFDWQHFGSGEWGIGFWDYTVVRELGPVPLYLSIAPGVQNLQFYWSGVGTNYVYTLERKESLASTNWCPLTGASWPLKTNHWTLALTNAPAPFYRVKAEPGNP
jgi:hypothetical protein